MGEGGGGFNPVLLPNIPRRVVIRPYRAHQWVMFKGIVGAIRELTDALVESRRVLVDVMTNQLPDASAEELDALRVRLDEMERTRALWEGEVEGLLLKAGGEKRQARSAEERARALAAKTDALSSVEGGEEELPPEYMELLREGNEAASGESEVQPVRSRVVRSNSAAMNRKFGISD